MGAKDIGLIRSGSMFDEGRLNDRPRQSHGVASEIPTALNPRHQESCLRSPAFLCFRYRAISLGLVRLTGLRV